MHLIRLRELRLATPPQPGRPLHLSAASGLVRVGPLFLVVADDELQLGVFDVDSNAPGRLIRMIEGELPESAAERKKHKPDFEALTLLPPFDGYPRGALFALGSGSKKRRRGGVLLRIDPDGVDGSSSRVIDASNLFEALDREIDDLNIEGAVVYDDRLVLMHRGNRRHAANALASFSLKAILDSIRHDDIIGNATILALERYDLGRVDDIPLCFTDGAVLPQGGIVFSAVAEDTSDNYRDGPCRAAAIGMIARDGTLQSVRALDSVCKIEGIHAQPAGDRVALWLVTDADDPSVPAAFLYGELRL